METIAMELEYVPGAAQIHSRSLDVGGIVSMAEIAQKAVPKDIKK